MKNVLIIIVLSTVILFSCNPAKRIMKNQDQFEQVGREWEKKNPCPPPKFEFKPGKVDSFYTPVINLISVLDSVLLQAKLDSLNKALRLKYNEIAKDCSRQVNEAYDVGYKQAIFETGKIKIPSAIHDTLLHEYIRRIGLLQGDLVKAAEKERDLQILLAKSESKANKWLWIAMALIVVVLVLLFLLIKNAFKITL